MPYRESQFHIKQTATHTQPTPCIPIPTHPWAPTTPGRILSTVLVTMPCAGPPSLIENLNLEISTDNFLLIERSK